MLIPFATAAMFRTMDMTRVYDGPCATKTEPVLLSLPTLTKAPSKVVSSACSTCWKTMMPVLLGTDSPG